MKNAMRLIILSLFLTIGINAGASERGTPAEAIAMVQKVIQSMKLNGRAKTIEDVNNKKYVDRDLYISINDNLGNSIANSIHPKMVGRNVLDMKDVDGTPFVREARDMVKVKGKGWVDYKWPNPTTQQIEQKSLYVEEFEGLAISCGVFRPKK